MIKMKNHYYSLNEILEFYKNFNFPIGGRMSGLKRYLTTYGMYSDTDAIYIRRKDLIKMKKEYYSISIAYFNEYECISGKQVNINNLPDLETALKRVYNHKRLIKASAKKGVNTIYDIAIRHFVKAPTGQYVNDITIQNGNIIVY